MTQPSFHLPKTLYHGTRSSHLALIDKNGLVPRSLSGSSNWAHTVESREDAVYLTSAYALHYANACEAPGWPTLLEIDTEKLDPLLFASDEDGVAQLKQGRLQAGAGTSLSYATEYWRERIHTVHPSTSLGSIGNCTYFGVIETSAISRVLVLTPHDAMRLTMQACDPVVSVANFRFLGPEYQEFMRWVFDAKKPWKAHFNEVQPPTSKAVQWSQAAIEAIFEQVGTAKQRVTP